MTYLDSNATTALWPAVLEEMLPWMQGGYANPSGVHREAKRARAAIERAREQVAALIGAHANEIIFTSGGTESNNTALRSLDHLSGPGDAVVSAIEHSAVLRTVEQLGRPVRRVAVDGAGRLEFDDLGQALEHAGYLSVMAVNNETGVIQALAEIVAMAQAKGVPVHSDAVQAVGKMDVKVLELGVDLLSLSAHKFHGPKGVGALYVRRGLRFEPLMHGGGQEFGMRSGTENTAGIVGMGAAAALAEAYLTNHGVAEVAAMRDAFESRVMHQVAGVTVNGGAQRVGNTSHLSFDGCDAAGLLILLDEAGVACSAGSACMTGKQKPSHVQLAMGIAEARAKSSLRFSFSRMNTESEAIEAAAIVARVVEKLRRVQGGGVGPVVVYSP